MNHARIVLAKVVPSSTLPIEQALATQHLDRLMGSITAEHLPKEYKLFWTKYTEHYQIYGSLPDEDLLVDRAPDQAAALAAIYKDLSSLNVSEDKHKYALDQLITAYERQQWSATLAEGMELIRSQGVDSSQAHVLAAAAGLKGDSSQSQDIDARDPAPLITAYQQAKSGEDDHRHYKTGYQYYDDATGGGQRGELWLIAAHTGEGKSFLMINMALNGATKGKNVVIGSAEMPPSLVLRRLVTAHAHHPQFGLRHGLKVNDVKFGRLDAKQEEIFLTKIIPDLQDNPQ